jgi:teichuronic acid biosynthesis glycosyltransferase TuaC
VKKILIFSLAYYPRVGGAEVAIKEITDRISDVEFEMITMRFSHKDVPQEKVGNVLVHRVGQSGGYVSKILFAHRAARLARQLHAQKKFDGAWAMMSYMVLPIVFAKLGIPYALTLQEGDTEHHMFGRLRVWPVLGLLKRGFREARVVSALSTFLAAWARRMGYRGEVEIVPNGADIKKFEGEKIPHQGTVLITSSRLVHKNAVDDIIRALPLVPEVRLQIAGVGPDEGMLKKLADELGVAERIEWLGFVDHSKLPTLLHAADIFIRPSRSEGFGSSFAEAFAAGLPVIATQEGGLKDFITPEVAWPVQKDSPHQIVAQIRAILSNPERTTVVVERAKQLAVARYDWQLIARDMREKVFSRLFHD